MQLIELLTLSNLKWSVQFSRFDLFSSKWVETIEWGTIVVAPFGLKLVDILKVTIRMFPPIETHFLSYSTACFLSTQLIWKLHFSFVMFWNF